MRACLALAGSLAVFLVGAPPASADAPAPPIELPFDYAHRALWLEPTSR